ncbi:hypothetical protein [Streptomyces omiyaensis]|uniref:Uncharacterized protein n=1 Tax=Streptomyces omiyaensis TaxID=68247 RepID=A0ABW7BR88_9ACTN|nr:hypothetical protein [Streptomyces omiyaensis]GGY59928.1 hypothetical protein GCM10010363_46780 [Streptomyces omiyaensis]
MSKTEHETSPRAAAVCPVCAEPLTGSVKKRHKTLGVFVPVWAPGPCHNPDCSAYLVNPEETGKRER